MGYNCDVFGHTCNLCCSPPWRPQHLLFVAVKSQLAALLAQEEEEGEEERVVLLAQPSSQSEEASEML